MRPTPLLAVLFALACPRAASAEGGDAPAPPPAARPKLAVDRTAHDFGAVKQNAEVKTEFTVENRGDATLHVRQVRADCGCAKADIDRREIEPRGKAKVSVTFLTYTFVGPQRKQVRLETDDPERPSLDLDVAVDVCAGIVLEPANFFFEPALVGASPTAKVVAKWKEGVGRPFRVTNVEAAGIDVRFTTEAWDAPPWHGRTITMAFPKPPPVGIVSGKALITTDDPDAREIQALVHGTISGKVWLERRAASLGLVQYGRGATLEIPCRGFDATVDLGEVTAAAKKGRVEAKAVRDPSNPRAWKIAIRLPADAAAGAIDDVVEVHTRVAGEAVVEIRVTGTVLPKPT